MQRVGLNLLIFPPLPRREADVYSRAPGASGRDGGTEARQVFLPRRPTQGNNYSAAAFIYSTHKPRRKKGPSVFSKIQSGIQRSPGDQTR